LVPFGGVGKLVNTAGYSDHCPIKVTIHDAN
jgi:hypothetical protein